MAVVLRAVEDRNRMFEPHEIGRAMVAVALQDGRGSRLHGCVGHVLVVDLRRSPCGAAEDRNVEHSY
ncbi:hypothetical protein [Streptomyces sp. NBC_01092]|uniref:hypothetical protein n=1 Tax=Streptomyces sp. NBC_01092 TaxID=2903748 RepID=UPI003869FA51|nr:hypothetical protein OG254_38610 [Streptomyces sp. NBC_01092]